MNKFLEFKSRSKLQKKQLRSANNIDLLRLIAALSIVWFHNPLYWNISSYLYEVNIAKTILLSWAMPFFYSISIYFIILKSYTFEQTFYKLKNILLLIILWTLVYEIIRFNSPDAIYSKCFISSSECNLSYLFVKFRTVNNTPGYYLSEIFSLLLFGYFFLYNCITKVVVMILSLYLIFVNQIDPLWIFLNPMLPEYFLMAFFAAYIFKSISSQFKVDFGFSSHIIMIFGAILVIGFANLLIKSLSPDLQKYITFLIAFTSFLFFIGLNKLTTCKSPIFMYLSEMGQKYSFGIFICHQACYDIFTRFINNFFGSLHINNPLIQYLSLGSVIMIVSFLTTVIFYRYLPRLFHY